MDLVMSVTDKIHVLDFGVVIASGDPAEIRRNRTVQKAYLGYSDEPAHDTLTDMSPVELTAEVLR